MGRGSLNPNTLISTLRFKPTFQLRLRKGKSDVFQRNDDTKWALPNYISGKNHKIIKKSRVSHT